MSEHAVIVRFTYGLNDLDALFALEDRLDDAIERAAVGEYDGHEIATDLSDGSIYMYGPDADDLFAVVLPVLRATDFTVGASVVRRYGEASDFNAREEHAVI
jgi:hypothetical protein